MHTCLHIDTFDVVLFLLHKLHLSSNFTSYGDILIQSSTKATLSITIALFEDFSYPLSLLHK